jgi:hypothetical protein
MRTALVIAALLAAIYPASADTIRFDFETGDPQGWTVLPGKIDDAASAPTTHGDRPGWRLSESKRGESDWHN